MAFILSFWKLNPLQEQHADLFGMTQKQCREFVHGLNEILQWTPKQAGVVPAQTGRALQEALSKEEISKDKMLLRDGIEREISPPVDDEL